MSILRLFARLETLGINLKLVDGQLKINAPRGTLTPVLIDELKDKKAEIIEFLQKHAQKREKYASIEVVENKQYYPLSSVQKRLYFIRQMDPEGTAYNMPAVRELIGVLDKEKLYRAFCQLISRHESLRTSFQVVKEEPVQVIHKNVEFEIDYYDRKEVEVKVEEERSSLLKGTRGLAPLFIKEFIRPFDLSQAPLLRVGLIGARSSPPNPAARQKEILGERYILMVDMHHIISDGKSLEIFIKEFMSLYREEDLPELRIQYKDYTQWQKSYPQQTLLNLQKEYWLKEFQGELPVLNLPTDYPRPAIREFEGTGVEFKISSQATAAVKELAIKSGATLYMVLLALYTILLSKICNQEDIIVGTPAAGRKHAELENIIGMFVNTLALRNFPAAEKTFSQFLAEVKDRSLAAFAHQDYIYEDLVEAVAVERDTSRNPLFDTLFALQNLDIPDINIPGLKVKPLTYEVSTVKFDLSLDAFETKESLHFVFGYGTRLFRENTIQRFVTYFKRIITAVVENSRIKLSRIDILPEDEKKQILVDFNDTVTLYPGDKTIHELFEVQAECTPHQIALSGPRNKKGSDLVFITYHQLNKESGQLARLLQERGVKPGTIAGMMVQRSVEMVTSILGILKAGAAYMPIDPDYPEERKQYMLADIGASVLSTHFSGSWDGGLVNYLPGRLSSHLHLSFSPARSLAYVMYTSGSTGRSKGVMIEHRSVVGRIINANFIDVRAGARLLLTGSMVFDITTFEIWWPLLNGLQLVMVDENQVLDARALKQVITKNKITVMHLIPQLLNQLAYEDIRVFAGLDYFLVGGDLVRPRYVNLLRNKYPDLKILHMYGPTENTAFSTFLPVDRDYTAGIPIGKPVSNCHVYIMDNHFHLQPVGAAGELCVSGVGVARGYLNNPELTEEKFDHDLWDYRDYHDEKNKSFCGGSRGAVFSKSAPLAARGKLYKTGDLGRWLIDGNIEFIGRIDHQVKIRGMRVELGEIESRLLAHEGVKDAVLMDREYPDGDKYLCAYITPAGGMEHAPGIADLQDFLGQRLPNYMVPSFFVFLHRLPLNPNGKIDKKALPEPDRRTDTGSAEAYAAPRTRLQEKLAGLWSAVLGMEKESISIHADFFRLGGHSLKATTLAAKIHKELGIKVPLVEIFKNPTIRKLSGYIKGVNVKDYSDEYISIEPVEKRNYYPLSSAQKRLFILYHLDTNNIGYNSSLVVLLEGKLDKEKFADNFRQLIHRHESLRTSFHLEDEAPVKVVHHEAELEIEYDRSLVNCQGTGEVSSPIKVEKIIKNFIRPFNLFRAPLLRVGLIHLDDNQHILMVDMHHIITDGTSYGIFIKDFTQLYAGKELLPLKLQYKDYARWQNSDKQRKTLKAQEEYWSKQFAGDIPILNLPYDYPRPLVQDFAGETLTFKISGKDTAALKALVLERETTLYMLLLSVYNILLSKLSAQEDIIVGTPTAGRRHADQQHIIGMFVNTLALRNFPTGEKTFKEFLEKLKQQTLEAFENQDYQFEDLVEKVDLERDASRNPLFDTMFALQNLEIPELDIHGLKVKPYHYETRVARFDLTLQAYEVKTNLLFKLEYCLKLFRIETIQRFIEYFKCIITAVLKDSEIKLSQIEIIPGNEKKQILEDFNNTVTLYPKDKTIHELFAEQVEKTPDNIAVIGKMQSAERKAQSIERNKERHASCAMHYSLTYRELNEKTQGLACLLREKGVGPDTIVGIIAKRSLEMIIGILGILKAGGGYLPIDPDYPEERMRYMLQDSALKILVTTQDFSKEIKFAREIIYISDAINRVPTSPHLHLSLAPAASLAYIIYTSGTTGKPKGVMTIHANVTRVVRNTNYIRLTKMDRVLQLSNYAFDGSVFDIYGALLNSAVLVMIKEEDVLAVNRLSEVIKRETITVFFVTTALFNALVDLEIECFKGLRKVLFGGEQVSVQHSEKALEYMRKHRIIHVYGPTETTVYATYYYIDEIDDSLGTIPIGKPIANTTVYILDKYLNVVPIGVIGELYIGGEGTARGYLNSPGLTAEKFDQDKRKKVPGERIYSLEGTRGLAPLLYRTGDLARWLSDGNIQFIGRIDHQIKIRGFRVELEEIQNQLLKYPGIKEAVVISNLDKKGDRYICAYIVNLNGVCADGIEEELKEFLSGKLPGYMIPSYFVSLEKIPLNPNGKVDRKALPSPGIKTAGNYVPPGNEQEEKLVFLWADVLARDESHASQLRSSIGIDDDFFHLGGHSLKAAILTAKIQKELEVKVSLAEIFVRPTIRQLVQYIHAASKEKYSPVKPTEKKDYYPLSSAQSRFYVLQEITPGSTAYNMMSVHQLEGVVDKKKFEESLKKLIKRHESLRTSFQSLHGQPVQRIHDDVEFKIAYDGSLVNCQGRGEVPSPIKVEKIIKNFIRPFDLSQAPLLRLELIKFEKEKHILMFDMHHIIFDGTSLTIFLRDVMEFYPGGALSPLMLQYKDFAQWQHDRLTKGKLKKEEEYWEKRFPGELPVLNMTTDFPRPTIQSFAGDQFEFKLDKSLTHALNGMIKETGTTLYMVLLAVYNVLLSRYTDQEDIIIGTTIAGRHHSDLREMIGLLIETLVQRNYTRGNLEFKTFLEMVKKETLESHENQAYPFRELIRKLGADNEVSRNPVFDAMLIVQNFEKTEFELEGLRFLPYQPAEKEGRQTSKVDFTIEAMEMEEEIHFTLEYCTRLYKRETMERFARHFINIIKEVVKNPAIQLANIQVISQEEKKQLVAEFNSSPLEIHEKNLKTVIERFADQVEKTPDNIAIVEPLPIKYKTYRTYMTYFNYRELNKKSTQLARLLIEKGVTRDTIVGIMMEPSLEMVISIFGILKAGGAYLPIDPDYPEERKQYLLADSGTKILLSEGRHPDFPTSQLPNFPSSLPSSLAYIIYTSGTTGRPKGVMVQHRNLSAYIHAFETEFHLQADDIVIQQVSYAFDAFVEELYPILLKGGKLVIPGKEMIKDIRALCDFIKKHQVTMITCSPQLLNELNDFPFQLTSLRIIISGGDRLKAEYIKNLMGVGEVYNTYGPTESTVCATYYRCSKDRELPHDVPIGKPITNYRVYILDKYHNLLPIGVSGELCVAGDGVTRGYLNRPELTNEKFLLNLSYIYKTGDLARWLPDGNIEFLGRIDRQVKIRGYRIELGEIENQLMALKEIKKALVIERERKSGQNYLTAYVVVETNRDQNQIPDTAEIKQRLARQLPGYMIPSYIVAIEEIPLTASGKADPKRLPLVDGRDLRPDQPFIAPQSKNEKIVAKIWKELLEVDNIGLDDNFFDLGGTSLDIFKVSTRINRIFNKQIPVVALFQHSTAHSLARYLEEGSEQEAISREKQEVLSRALDRGKNRLKRQVKEKNAVIDTGTHGTGLEIAVIGMAGKFPGARHIEEFWENLKNGVESITFFTDDELKSEGVDDQLLENSNYIKARGIIEGVEYFDSSFFGFASVEAQIMDPQMRIFLQCVWHALEDAGYEPFCYDRRIGLYAGASPNLNWEGFASFTSLNQGLSGFMVAQLADKDFMCTHISYKLNLKGPAVSMQTACSTSLVAIHWAVQGLLNGECEMALAGGVSISYPPKRGYIYQEGMIFSNDAHNRTFDAEARGSIFGDGVGAVVLKPLADAAADGDHIYAMIKGTAINNDGFRKVGYTAPSVEGQAEVIKAAQLMAEVKPESITYIEAHGTATPLGDTVEIEALKQAFNSNKINYCGIGTVKSNVGHLYSAAGVTGFIKTVLALNHRLIPPSLHFNTPNPEIDFENTPFYVNKALREWKNNGYPLRAGVSSFGIGGTNAHVILEEPPKGTRGLAPLSKYHLILLSAKTPSALDKMTENLVEYFKKNLSNRGNHENPINPGPTLADTAYTLQVGRKHFPYRRMLVSSTLDADFHRLALNMKRVPTAFVREENRPVVFMFCGQGSQYVNMGIDLYRTEPIFREEMDRCFEILKPLMDDDLKEILYSSERSDRSDRSDWSDLSDRSDQSDLIHQTEITQPLVFAFEYALAKLLIRWGIKPRAMIGYSFGEYIAACISGVFSLEDALKLVIIRGQLAQQTPPGAMTSVPLPEKELKPLLNEDLSLAIVNGPTCIVSGAKEAAAAFEKEMKKKRILCVPLNMSQAIHSRVMDPMREEFQRVIREFRLNSPQIPYISNVTAQWITGEEAANPQYWGDHLCSTVRFADGLKELLKQDNAIFIEIGPGRILGMMVRTHPDKKPGHMVLNTVKHQQEKVTDDYFLLEKVGQLWLQGQRMDWEAFYENEKRYRVPLPGYPFEGKRYWQDPNINPFQIGSGSQTQLLSRVSQPGPDGGTAPGPPGAFESQEVADETHEPPRNELEQKIAHMWQEYMGVEKVSIHDDFFYLNGNSLIATQLMARLIEEYQVEIPASRFYENPTIAHLAEIINELLEKK
ncbi:MAG: amino acid adenylation domain-containing protein [Candidatus Aminicenantes bacterium]|nr:MAG: amino acid adenylation domain-containing protein [Candidatus Aminicenantes bacterium]